MRFNFSSFGPAVARTSSLEALRAGIGAFISLSIVGLFVLSPSVDTQLGLYLVAPFGASAVLLFAVPNSPLAQPWSAIVGNTVAAMVAVAVCMVVEEATFRISLAVGLAISATILCRALHPPAGAIAMTAAMSPEAIRELGFMFALTPVALGTVILVLLAIIYARLTGRRYPFRHFEDPNKRGTLDPEPLERLGLSEVELVDILDRYRQSFNLGVEDLARLIGAAELQSASHRSSAACAGDIMSRDLITVAGDASLSEVADLFREYRFTALPVVKEDDLFIGVIFQIHLIDYAQKDAIRLHRRFSSAVKQLFDPNRTGTIRATEFMSLDGPSATPTTPLAALLPLMAGGDVDAIPILDQKRLVGIVTRTDLISALARSSLQR